MSSLTEALGWCSTTSTGLYKKYAKVAVEAFYTFVITGSTYDLTELSRVYISFP